MGLGKFPKKTLFPITKKKQPLNWVMVHSWHKGSNSRVSRSVAAVKEGRGQQMTFSGWNQSCLFPAVL